MEQNCDFANETPAFFDYKLDKLKDSWTFGLVNQGMQQATDAQVMMAFETHKKDMVVAYVLWHFLGVFGGHRFYMKDQGGGAAMLALTLISIPLMFVFIGFFIYFAVIVWWIVDAFMVHEWVKSHNLNLMESLGMAQSAPPPELPEQGSVPAPNTSDSHSAS